MKTSDVWASLFELSGRANSAESEAANYRARADRLCEWGRIALTIVADLRTSLDAASITLEEAAEAIAVCLESGPFGGAAQVANAEGSAPRRGRGPDRAPRARKSHVAPIAPPLSPVVRASTIAVFDDGPLTLAGAAVAMGLSSEEAEALLCEDDEAFVSWTDTRPGDSQPVALWGTWQQFLAAIGKLTIVGPKSGRAKFTATALVCSIGAAERAWRELDPGASA